MNKQRSSLGFGNYNLAGSIMAYFFLDEII